MKTQDKRRDSGEYYPGGRVIARPGTAPQQVVVQWSDVQNKPQIAPLPERYRDSDVKTKINEITSKFATVVMAALLGWTALGGVTVHTARKDQIYNDEPVVTNVTYSAEAETDPTVPAWAKAAEPPQTMTTNAVGDIIHATVDGAARPLPKYLHIYEADNSYPDEAAEYYRSRGDGKTDGGCSAVRSGGFLYRNFDFPFDQRAEFIVKMSAGEVPTSLLGGAYTHRFASIGVAQVGTNLTEAIVTSGKPSRCYKWLPGATVDGINENGVVAEINVVDGDPHDHWPTNGTIHCLGAVRWVLDNATNAASAASQIAAEVFFPAGWSQNYHWMIADQAETWIVENGEAHAVTNGVPVMTNFRLDPTRDTTGAGQERYDLLLSSACCITNAWFTRAYHRSTTPPWVSDLAEVIAYTNDIYNAWTAHDKEYFRGKTNNGEPWWQTVHTSIYDISNRTLRVAVQETDDWYTFAVPSAGGTDEAKVREIASEVVAPVASSVSSLQSSKIGTNGTWNVGSDFKLDFGGEMGFEPASRYGWSGTAVNGLLLMANGFDNFYDAFSGMNLADALAEKADRSDLDGYLPMVNPYITFDSECHWIQLNTRLKIGTATKQLWANGDAIYYGEFAPPEKNIEIAVKGDLPVISATDPTFSNAVKTVMQIEDRAQNLSYTITADDKRFYFTPTGAINPED